MDHKTIHININGTAQEGSIVGYRLGGNADELSEFMQNRRQPQFMHKIKRIIEEVKYAERNFKKFCLLTRREKEIIALVASGQNNPDISRKLFISRRTVEQHRKNINRKLEINSLQEVCVFAYAFDLV